MPLSYGPCPELWPDHPWGAAYPAVPLRSWLTFPRLPPETSWRGEPSGSLNVPGGGTLTLPFIWECPFPVPLVLANLVDRALPRARPGRTGGGAPLPPGSTG